MTDQPKSATATKTDVRPPEAASPAPPEKVGEANRKGLDPASASAALAKAVASAGGTPVPGEKKPEPTPRPVALKGTETAAPARSTAPRRAGLRIAALAAAAVAALGAGFAGGQVLVRPAPEPAPTLAQAVEAVRSGREDLARISGEVAALKGAVGALREAVERVGRQASDVSAVLGERLERAERGPEAAMAPVARIAEQLDRLEGAMRDAVKDPAQRFAGLADRLDRIERQVAAVAARPAPAPAAPAAPAPAAASAPAPEAPTQTGSLGKDAPVEGWTLREVYDGVALIESRNRRLVEVSPGDAVPGVGRVDSIERRGKRWVVVTQKGVIEMAR